MQNGVSGAAALLAHSAPLSTEQRELLDLLQAGASQVVLIVEDILQHGALASGNFPLAPAPTHLRGAVLEPALRMARMAAARSGRGAVALRLDVGADVPAVVRADGSRLTQVLTNLLSNALKFCQAERGAIDVRVDVIDQQQQKEDAASRWLRFEVRDNGCGIALDALERIFEPFRQESESTVRQYGGTGLGLTICRRIAGAMRGTLRAHSDGKGRGAAFTLTVPLEVPSSSLEEAAQSAEVDAAPTELAVPARCPAAAPPPPLDASALRVLVAEDDAASRVIMRKLLSRLRAHVTCVEDGAAAVEVCASAFFDIVLMDLHMPRLDGLQASAAILSAATTRRPAIVALTASCSEEVKARCAAAGMTAHLSKPVNTAHLEALIRQQLLLLAK